MSGGLTAAAIGQTDLQGGFAKTWLERQGQELDIGAPVTGAAAVGNGVAASFGDGTVRFFQPDDAPVVAHAHRGAVLCLEANEDHVVTGGDDGRFLSVSTDGVVEEIATFGTRWVDCVTAARGQRACSSGRVAHVWRTGQSTAMQFEHPSTVGGLAFDAKGNRLAVAHYGGATVWERGERRWKRSKLAWKGSHGAVTFSPDGKFLVTTMQENALHGWRLRDKSHMEMAGYPTKIKSFAWVGDTPYLATSGADEAVCWPFDQKHGPLGRDPLCIGAGSNQLVTAVQGLVGQPWLLLGFQDGIVLLAGLDGAKAFVLRKSTGVEVTTLAVTKTLSHILIGDANGCVLWAPLPQGGEDARNV